MGCSLCAHFDFVIMDLNLDDIIIMCLCLTFIDSLIWNLNWTKHLLNFYSTIKCSKRCLSCGLFLEVSEPSILTTRSMVAKATFGPICQLMEIIVK
jgi:hypothetical protein